jgi:alpha-beta hydrolase superfamily lysophospholipase
VHGLAEHSGRYERTGDLLAAAGFRVRAFDLIGAGASGGRRWDIDDWTRYHEQIEGHVGFAHEMGQPVVLLGHSMGGNLVLGYLMADRLKPHLAVVTAPALGGGAAWQRSLAPVFARLAPTASLSNNLKPEQLSRDPAVGEAYFADPLVIRTSTPRLGAALFAAMDQVRAGAAAIDVPTLVLHGGSDTIVPPQSTVALGELTGFERRLYPSLRHEILNEPEGPQVIADIVDWVSARI